LEVLKAIYEGDANYKEAGECAFQYKVGEDGDSRSFVLEISWTENYPEEIPNINLDAFYNKHLVQDVKSHIISKIQQEAEQNLGLAMTYTLFEWAKENCEDLMAHQPDKPISAEEVTSSIGDISLAETTGKVKDRKPQLTKAQKRKLFDRLDNKGERPRGWDWVDIVKHLSQSGSSKDSTPPPTS